mmetsp:Transcript_57502/g.113305  ORF Transcript_57502/g.113305 Transcript_57502/m.113305 type:complete len:212 (-) Transcript_57502:913-1548(-)
MPFSLRYVSAMVKATSRACSALSRGSQCVVYTSPSLPSVTSSMVPPKHSVTDSPVISKCTPPACVPSARCTSKNPATSSRIADTALVLYRPSLEVMVLPCTGSVIHSTCFPAASTAFTRRGKCSRTFVAPMRTTSVTRPGRLPGLTASRSSTSSSSPHLSLIFTPMGLWMPRTNSRCPQSSCRVRSPTQSMCAEQSYHCPVVESWRVRASS